MKSLLQNQWARYVIVLLIGAAVGAIFYPSKTITREETVKMKEKIQRLEQEKKSIESFYNKKIDQQSKEYRESKEELSKKTETLKQENTKLKQRVSEKLFRIVRPDGTIEEKWFKESETDVVSSTVTKIKDEFTRKVKSIENKWKKIHEKRIAKVKENFEKRIAETRKSERTRVSKEEIKVNERSFGISVGLTTDQSYFSSITYDVYGPVFLDVHLGANSQLGDREVGIGFGFRF